MHHSEELVGARQRRRRRPPTPTPPTHPARVQIFLMTRQNQTEWCSKKLLLLIISPVVSLTNKVWRIFCGIFIFHQVLDLFFFLFLLLFCVVYWNNTALCQKDKKKKKRCRNYRVNFLFIDIDSNWSPYFVFCFVLFLDVWMINSLRSDVRNKKNIADLKSGVMFSDCYS